MKRKLTVPEQHQLRVTKRTLEMNDVMAAVMGGPTKEQARAIIAKLTGETSDAVSILHSRFVGSDPERKSALQQARDEEE